MKHAPKVRLLERDGTWTLTMSSDGYAEHRNLAAPVDLGDCGEGLRLDEVAVLTPGRVRVPATVLSLGQLSVSSRTVEWLLGEARTQALDKGPAPVCAAWTAGSGALEFAVVAMREADRRRLREIHAAAGKGLAFAMDSAGRGGGILRDGIDIVGRKA